MCSRRRPGLVIGAISALVQLCPPFGIEPAGAAATGPTVGALHDVELVDTMAGNQTVGARLRVVIAPGIGIGPGKAAMLEGVRDTGSIAAAGRRIGMSYKRAWLIVAALNTHFDAPLIEASKGGKAGGGAQLAALGEEVLAAYGEMLALTEAAITAPLARLAARLAKRTPATEPEPIVSDGTPAKPAPGPRNGRGSGCSTAPASAPAATDGAPGARAATKPRSPARKRSP